MRRARWSLVLTVSDFIPRMFAVSSTLASSTSRMMRTVRNAGGKSSIARSNVSDVTRHHLRNRQLQNGTSDIRHRAHDVALRQNADEPPAAVEDHQRTDAMRGEQLRRRRQIGWMQMMLSPLAARMVFKLIQAPSRTTSYRFYGLERGVSIDAKNVAVQTRSSDDVRRTTVLTLVNGLSLITS
jgi:hypothetical protein